MKLTDLLLVIAIALAVAGVVLIYVPAGLIAAGIGVGAIWHQFFDEVAE